MAGTLLPPNPRLVAINPKDGTFTPNGLQLMQSIIDRLNGTSQDITSTATNVGNVYTIIPSSTFSGYYDFVSFTFTAPATSTGPVTAGVQGAGTPLKVFKSDGTTQLDTGDIIADQPYTFTYSSALDSGAGGFTISTSVPNNNYLNIIKCNCTDTANQLTLAPQDGSIITSYNDLDTYIFVSSHTATGAVTMRLNSLAFKVARYASNGNQMTSGTCFAGAIYIVSYSSASDTLVVT